MVKELVYNNATLYYSVYGKGKPVVLLHGFAETSAIWKNQTGFLSEFCKVIVPDLPGSGKSGMISSDEETLSVEALAESVYAIIKNEEINQCIMIGHSMGGYITLAFAEKYAGTLKGFGFVHSTAFADDEEKKKNRLKGIAAIEKYGSYSFLKTSLPGLFSAAYKKEHAAVIDALIEEGKNFSKENLQQYYYAMMNRPGRSDVLKQSKIPVMFIAGEEDTAAPLSDVLKQAHLPEIAYIHVIKSGHMGMLEKPAVVNKMLKEFIDEME